TTVTGTRAERYPPRDVSPAGCGRAYRGRPQADGGSGVMGTGHLRGGEAELLLAVLEAARHDDPGPAVPWSLLDGLLRLVPCDLGVSYQCHDYRHRRGLFLQAAEEDGGVGVEGALPSEEEDRFFQF